jgi:acetyl/propionyl-CoA carboxylase alpha subunit
MAVLGDKRSAKQYLLKHATQVPLIPGYNGSEQNEDQLLLEADRIGFPVLIKASAGGGGKGMRIVRERQNFVDELKRARSEAQRSFGSSDCILEKYIERSKHVEIQIVGDRHGRVVSLLDRECSIQRRHQKVIEESPSPWLSPDLRRQMSKTAISIGALLEYESAGTVEFIVDIDTAKYYFLEVNTRIQVEHPITEEVVGLDIVALQIYVASGGRLDALQSFNDGMAPQVGHAIECRLCAEDPARDFMPDLGTIVRWTPATEILPAPETSHVRFETGIETGSEISINFDSLIAKVVVWAPTRELAIKKMTKVLGSTVCIGIRSNQSFLQACLSHPRFHDPEYTTSFIPDLMKQLLVNPFVPNLAETARLLAFTPSLHRRIAQAIPGQRPFSSISHGFRNQKADPASVQADVVEIVSQPSQSFIVGWPSDGSQVREARMRTVNIAAVLARGQGETTSEEAVQSPSIALARQYNSVSTQIRRIGGPTDLSSHSQHNVRIQTRKRTTFRQSSSLAWDLQDLVLESDGNRYFAYTAISSTPSNYDSGSHQKFYMHITALGTNIEYRLHSLLSYGESLRRNVKGSSTGVETNPRAPMPCKILGIPKKDGDVIDIGEVGMVVESMKMEMNVLANAKGKFKAMFQQGDAVEEGVILFTVT